MDLHLQSKWPCSQYQTREPKAFSAFPWLHANKRAKHIASSRLYPVPSPDLYTTAVQSSLGSQRSAVLQASLSHALQKSLLM